MRRVVSALLGVLWPQEKPKPADLVQFEEARKRLHGVMKTVGKEADAFGSMVKGMQAPERTPCKKSASPKKRAVKKSGG